MTGQGSNLPEDVLNRVGEKKREALQAEIQALEGLISSGLESHLEGRRIHLDGLMEARKKESEEAAMRELKELQSFGESTLRRLDAELVRRKSDRLRDENRRREERIVKEKREEEAKKRQAEEEARKQKAAADDPSAKVRTILRHAQNHMQRGDMELAGKSVLEGLEIDGFNAELLDLDAKIREAMASETFSPPATTAPGTKQEKGKGKQAKSKQPKSKPPKQPTAQGAPATPGQRKFPSWAFTVIAAVLIIGAAVIAYFEYMPKPAEKSMTLAVMPWTTTSDPREMRVFTDALPEVLLKNLSTTTSAVNLLGYTTNSNLASLGSDPVSPLIQLGYSHFLRGQLTRTDSFFTVHVELSDSGGATLWSEDYQRDTTGLVLIPHEIAHSLRTYFHSATAPSGGTAVQMKNTEAYILYLRGLNALRKPDRLGLDDAVNAFNRSLSLDSTLAETYAGLSTALAAKHMTSHSGADDPLAEAGSAASTAIALNPRSSEGYIAMSRVLIERHLYDDALEMLDSAARFSPGENVIPFLRGLTFFRSGQTDKALEILQRAFRLDPRNAGILGLIATIHQVNKSFDKALWYHETAMFFSADTLRYIVGRLSDVIVLDPTLRLNQAHRVTTACMKLLERDPREYQTLYSLARILQASGDIEESNKYLNGLESLLRARFRSNPNDTRARSYLGLTLTRLGRYADGISIGEAAVAADTDNIETKYLLARIYALQLYSSQTKTVDSTKLARTMNLLTGALNRRFIDEELCSADLYNVYSQSDIRRVFGGGSAEKP